MNTPQLQQVRLADIVPTSDNQRKDIEKGEDFLNLARSIKGGGVRLPVILRPHPDKKGKYELRAGERRYWAAKSVCVETIPAIVYTDLSDDEAMDLTFIENKFRKDLKPMEEAAEVALWSEKLGGDIKAIAKRLGKKERWVRLRANISANLIAPWKKAVEKDPRFGNWTVKHLTQIARLPAVRQKQLMTDVERYSLYPRDKSAADLKDYIAKELRLLSGAKWELDDATLVPKAGACSACVKRSGHQPMLWFDSDEQAKGGDQCLDGHCYIDKEFAVIERRAAELRGQHPKMMLILPANHRGNVDKITEKLGPPLSNWQYKTCKKTDKAAVPAMYVGGKAIGKLTYIKVDTGSAGAGGGKIKGTPTPLKARRAALDAKRWAQVLIDLKEKVEKTNVGDITFGDKVTAVMAMVAFQGNSSIGHEVDGDLDKELARLVADKKNGQGEALIYLWESFKPTLKQSLTYCGPITQTPKQYIKEAEWIARIIGADVKAMFKEVSKSKGFTEPKSWKNLNADGTEKKVKVKRGKKDEGRGPQPALSAAERE